MHNPVNTVISFVLMITIVGGSFYYVYALTPRGPWMGITGGGFLDPEAAELLGLDQEQGFLIFAIRPGGPADKAGLQAGGDETVNIGGQQIPIDGDIIISIDGKHMNERGDECSVLEQKTAGDSVRLVIYRNGSLQETNLILEEVPRGQPSPC